MFLTRILGRISLKDHVINNLTHDVNQLCHVIPQNNKI